MKNAMSVLGIRGHKGQNSTGTRSPRFLALESRCRGFFITWHKGQNSKGTRCRGFLALASRCRGFSVLEPRCRGFFSSQKTPWNHDNVAYLSPFLDVVVFWSWNLDVVVFWSWNLDVVYMCLHGLVFVIIVKTKKSRIIMSIMLLKILQLSKFMQHLST